MNESVGWAAVVMSSVAMIGGAIKTVSDSVSARRTASDKLQYDTKLVTLELTQARCLEDHKNALKETCEIKLELKACRDHHQEAAVDRAAMNTKIAALETKVAAS